jgi:hypothetical protein
MSADHILFYPFLNGCNRHLQGTAHGYRRQFAGVDHASHRTGRNSAQLPRRLLQTPEQDIILYR